MFKKIQKSRKGSALLVGLTVTVLLSILVIGFLEKSLRLNANAKSIEHSVQAYYLATSNIETKLQVTWPNLKKKPWTILSDSIPINKGFSGSYVVAHTGSNIIPAKWLGNSPFDKDYNIISLDRPVQLAIQNVDWNNTSLELKSPFDNVAITGSGEVLWTLWNSEKVLYAQTGSLIKIDGSMSVSKIFWFLDQWFYNDVTWERKSRGIGAFYDQELLQWAKCSDFSCTLKLSMLSPAKTADEKKQFPFLEYKITFPTSDQIPLQFMTLDATGYVGDYARKRSVQIPQITTNTALDFAVLQ